jgi:hypothetical protein
MLFCLISIKDRDRARCESAASSRSAGFIEEY